MKSRWVLPFQAVYAISYMEHVFFILSIFFLSVSPNLHDLSDYMNLVIKATIMKIIQQRDKLLSNFEVYRHIVDVQKENSWGFTIPKVEKKRKQKFDPRLLDLEIITRDLSQYLVKMDQGNEVKTENFVNLMLVLNTFELEVIEKLMIMNSLPRSLVNLYAIIEECEGRFSQDQCEEMLQNVEKYFPAPVNEDEEEADEEEEIEEDVEMQNADVQVAVDEEDEAAFVQDDEFEHEGFKKKQNEDKEIDEVES